MKLEYLALYLIFINVVAVIICIIEKLKAKIDGWRVSEKTLFIVSAIGGALGMYITMQLIRHKTKHKRFMIGLPVIILVQCAFLIYLLHLCS